MKGIILYLITGGAGYIGSHMALKLLDLGHDVVIFDNLEVGHIQIVENIKSLFKKVCFVQGDLKNKADIDNVFRNYPIEAVVHFAAYSLVGESVSAPKKYWENNVVGSMNLLNSMLDFGVDKIVFSSTCATYGEPNYVPIDELHPQNPINPYGQTKLVVEKIMDDYDRAYGLRSVRLRYFNVAGADKKLRTGEWHDVETHLIPNIIKSTLEQSRTFEIYGDTYSTKDGTCVRDYIDMDDLTDAHVKALLYLEAGGKTDYFNLGTQKGNSVKEVFECAKKITGKNIPYVVKERREGDPETLIGNSKKAKEILNWSAKNTLEESIKNAYLWEQKRQKLYR